MLEGAEVSARMCATECLEISSGWGSGNVCHPLAQLGEWDSIVWANNAREELILVPCSPLCSKGANVMLQEEKGFET